MDARVGTSSSERWRWYTGFLAQMRNERGRVWLWEAALVLVLNRLSELQLGL